MIKAVLFDMDGILFDTEIVMKEGWQKAARELNFTLTEEHLSQMRGSALPRSRKLFEEWFHGKVTYDEGRAIRSAYWIARRLSWRYQWIAETARTTPQPGLARSSPYRVYSVVLLWHLHESPRDTASRQNREPPWHA